VTAWHGGMAIGGSCARVAQRHNGNGRCEWHTKGEILSRRQRRMVSWIGGVHPGVHMAQHGVPAHRAYPATCACVGLCRGRQHEASLSSSWRGHPGWRSDGRQ
jgi:hypothetical protein